MDKLSLLKKLNNAPKERFEVLDYKKSLRMAGAKTLYIPSVAEVSKAICDIQKGETRTIKELRETLAKNANAETACPAAILKYWKWMANLPEEVKIENSNYDIPWWRVLKDGKPSRHMPGGIENQKLLLKSEGYF